MPLVLSAAQTISVDAYSIQIDYFKIDPNNKKATIRYFLKDGQSVDVTAKVLDVTDANFDAAIENLEFYVAEGHTGYGAVKRALYDVIKAAEGVTGDVV